VEATDLATRYALLSDIHSNVGALTAVLRDHSHPAHVMSYPQIRE